MSNAVTSVIIASASAVAKVYLIGAVGYYAVKRPKGNPLLPRQHVGMVARWSFSLLLLPLIYSTIASTLSADVLVSLWFVPVAAILVISTSFMTATILGKLPFFRLKNPVDFEALRIAASFPNIVAIPILIFPSLCEYEVVYSSFSDLSPDASPSDMSRDCTDKANTMIFLYFFAWNFLFWAFGNRRLVRAGKRKQNENDEEVTEESTSYDDTEETCLQTLLFAIKQTVTSPGFIAMILGLITAFIPPLQAALFSPGAPLRFIGSAVESLGTASSSISTIIVAASLVIPQDHNDEESVNEVELEETTRSDDDSSDEKCEKVDITIDHHGAEEITISSDTTPSSFNPSPVTIDPEQQQRITQRPSIKHFKHQMKRRSTALLSSIKRIPSLRMYIWFILSRLIIPPAIICVTLIGLDCGGVLEGVPDLAKLVIMINASVPGALLVVVVLKSQGLSETASIVARVYLPSYLLSIVTIAGWTAVGLLISIPGENRISFCSIER